MSDQRLRELERRYRTTGDAQDEAAWLAERCRSEPGLRERLWAAGCVGHAGAVELLGERTPPRAVGLKWRIGQLALGGRPVLVAAASAAFVPLGPGGARGQARLAVVAAEALHAATSWLSCPTPARAHLARAAQVRASSSAHEVIDRDAGEVLDARSVRLAIQAEAAANVALLAGEEGNVPIERVAGRAIEQAALVARGDFPATGGRAQELARALRHGWDDTWLFDDRLDVAVNERVVRGVLEWALAPAETPWAGEARALAEARVSGRISLRMLRLAALAGAPAARATLVDEAPAADLWALLDGLARVERSVFPVVAEAAVAALPESSEVQSDEPRAEPARAVDLLAACKGARTGAEARRYAEATVRWCLLRQATHAAGVSLERCRELEASLVPGVKREPDTALLKALGVTSLDALFTAAGPVQAAVRAAIVAWALGGARQPS